MPERQTAVQISLIYHFCRVRLPAIPLSQPTFEGHIRRAWALAEEKRKRAGEAITWREFVENLHAVDLFLSAACLEGLKEAWECLFAARASRTDCLLVDALRLRAVRLYPRDELRQEQAVAEFWGLLLAGEKDGQQPILARFDGQRPLVPWLIRIFQNRHLSELRQHRPVGPLPDEDVEQPALPLSGSGDERWHEEFRLAARGWLKDLAENDLLVLGLRVRYRMSQREVAGLLGIHEGNVSRQTSKLRDRCLERIGQSLRQAGWTGDDLGGFVLKEMEALLLDEPRLSADRLAQLLAARQRGGVPAEARPAREGA